MHSYITEAAQITNILRGMQNLQGSNYSPDATWYNSMF